MCICCLILCATYQQIFSFSAIFTISYNPHTVYLLSLLHYRDVLSITAEIERRILYKSEYWEGFFYIKSLLHLDNPAPNIVGTALLSLISCLERNGSDYNKKYLASDV